jgi:mannan endo-1,4-beta-mannosidase
MIMNVLHSVPATVKQFANTNSNATDQAKELLNFLYRISGTRTLTGQHNTPREMSRYNDQAFQITGQHPAVWGQDFGFAADGDMDGVNFRQGIIDEARKQYAEGSIITLMWHAVRPTEDEPVTFEGSICRGLLDDADWKDLITPGTVIYNRWCRQVDVIAGLLAQLRDENIPVLWRPYHEMNGSWFWWGARPGVDGYSALYRQLYDRFVNYHRLDNLVWVWNANAPSATVLPYTECYPGHDVVDVLATDVYRNEFTDDAYETLVELGDGRPVALGEVGVAPTPGLLDSQPLWDWFMIWTNFLTRENTESSLQALFNSERALNRPAASFLNKGFYEL